ncbi:PREDICTED: adenylate kinase 8-like [Polistes dominula]|uniref:Adenylate kinase 8-like n=1 Tax=Polistes dominula TaxID=743375 RepID=A0ABM1IAH0_POLDO|nr:PREDICTED: adenylate kinase 8-like [Polistes dominula]
MCDFVDAIKRPLFIPPRFVAYLEKHKIYELFQELAKQLIIDQPEDHILYMKQCLEHAVRKRDIPRIILLAPPIFDKMALAQIFQKELGLQPITVKDLREKMINKNVCLCDESEDLAMNMKKLLKSGTLHSSGWILVDVPRTKKEARAFQRLGIIPTHVFQIIMSNDLGEISEKNSNCQFDNNNIHSININNEEMRTYKQNLRGLRDAYANFLIEIEIGIRSIEELGNDCIALTKIKKHSGAPSLFRIALIGSRGSGCYTLAKYLAKRFNLIHVDFNYIMKQARLQETPMGEVLRLFEHNCNQKLKARIQVIDVNNYIKKPECLNKGWVLTNYPVTVEDFKLLDMIDTPPNKYKTFRIIFVQVSEEIRKERLLNRRYNIITGSKHNLITCDDYKKKCDCELGVHPNDYVNVVTEQIREYDNNVEEMLEYAGESVFIIDGNADERSVRESVEGCLMQSKMYSKLREPQPFSKIDLRDVEFDPDDEPDISIFDTIMPPEFKYSFI